MEITGAQESVYTEMVSYGYDFIKNDGDDVIMALTNVVNDGPTEHFGYVRIEPNGKRWDMQDNELG